MIAINPSKLYRNPILGVEARGKWVPLLVSATNFYWHLAKTAPAAHAHWNKLTWPIFKDLRASGAYRDLELTTTAEQALADVLLTVAPVPQPSLWIQAQLDEYAKAGQVFVGSDPRAKLSQWVEVGKTAPVLAAAAGSQPTVMQAGAGSSTVGWMLLGAGLYLLLRGRK